MNRDGTPTLGAEVTPAVVPDGAQQILADVINDRVGAPSECLLWDGMTSDTMSQATQNPPASIRNRLAMLSSGITIALLVVLVVEGATQLRFDPLWVLYGIRGILIVAAASAIVSLWTSVVALRRRHWRRAISGMVLLLAVIAGSFEPMAIVRACNGAGSVLNCELHRGAFAERVAALPAADQPKFAIFIRGGMPFFSEGVIYPYLAFVGDVGLAPSSVVNTGWQYGISVGPVFSFHYNCQTDLAGRSYAFTLPAKMAAAGFLLFKGTYGPLAAMLKLTQETRPSEWLQELGTTAGAAVQSVLNSLSAPRPSQTTDGVASYIDAVAR